MTSKSCWTDGRGHFPRWKDWARAAAVRRTTSSTFAVKLGVIMRLNAGPGVENKSTRYTQRKHDKSTWNASMSKGPKTQRGVDLKRLSKTTPPQSCTLISGGLRAVGFFLWVLSLCPLEGRHHSKSVDNYFNPVHKFGPCPFADNSGHRIWDVKCIQPATRGRLRDFSTYLRHDYHD